MVVVDAPALPADHHDLLLSVPLKGWKVGRGQLDVDAQVLLPLRLQVLGALVVAGTRVVAVFQVLHLAAVRVPLLVQVLGSLGVELGVGVAVVAEISLEALDDRAAGGRLAGDRVGACDVGELVAVDRHREGSATVETRVIGVAGAVGG